MNAIRVVAAVLAAAVAMSASAISDAGIERDEVNLTSPSQVKAWCIANGFHPNRTLGQNFLIDRNALDAILDAAGLAGPTRVLEIGPGLGVLTEGLLQRGHSVTAIEKDPALADRLYGALQMFTFFTIPILKQYNGERGKWKGMKWLFYIYYPAHLVIIGIVRIALNGDIPIIF